VYESRPENYDQGGGVMLSPNALRVLDSVGVYQRARTRSFSFDILAFKDGNNHTTDEYYFGSEKIYGYPAIRIMRRELLDEMKAMLRERKIPIYYNSKLSAIIADGPEEVTFAFENGHTASAPLLVGADGIHSTVRRSFLPQVRPVYAGFMGIHSVVERAQVCIPEGYHLPATVMAKAGAKARWF
jgi:2-polyprenyl-6-methoxyphenol hydroxylase-like FAD-dependent oxidoreductase